MIARIPTRISRALIRMSPTKKTITMKLKIIDRAENASESGSARTRCQNVSRGITSARRLPHQRRNRHDGVAVRPQRVDQHRQRRDGHRTVAAAIMHQDDRAPERHGFDSFYNWL